MTAGPALTLPKTRRTAHVGRRRQMGQTPPRVSYHCFVAVGLSRVLEIGQGGISATWGKWRTGSAERLGETAGVDHDFPVWSFLYLV